MDLRSAIDHFDLERFVQDHGGAEKQPGEWTLFCPWCGKPKLIVSMRLRTWHCWRCQKYELRWTGTRYKRTAVAGAGGVLQLVMALERCTRQEAEARLLRGNVRRPGSLEKVELEALPVIAGPAKWGAPIAPPPAVRPFGELPPYLAQRGLTMDDVRAFGLTWCDGGRYHNRVIYPVFERGALVYWQARAMWDDTSPQHVKTLNPPRCVGAFTSAEVLFNYDQAIQVGRGHVCITEGPIDAVHAGLDAVCTFGKQISPTQIGKLLSAGVASLDLMWDADAEADAAMVGAQLASLFRVRLVRLPSGDPGDWPREHLQAFRAQALELHRPSRLSAV